MSAETVMDRVGAEDVVDGAVTTEVVTLDPAEEARSAFYDPQAVLATDGVARMLQESLLRRW